MTNEEYIQLHREDNVRALALKKTPDGVDIRWCLQQIEGRQLALQKLPHWASCEGLHYPPRLSMEQCSSEDTALYKQQLCERLLEAENRRCLMDLTGGLGIDFSYMSRSFRRAVYVEQMPHLCDLAHHNFRVLGMENVEVYCSDGSLYPFPLETEGHVIFLDPARRDTAGRKTVALEDCTPNLVELHEHLLRHARFVIAKLSPMLDITQAIRSLHKVTEVHVLSVKGECKELLLVMDSRIEDSASPTYYCKNLPNGNLFSCTDEERRESPLVGELKEGARLFEPNASLLKAGCHDAYACRLGLRKLNPQSNLYIAPDKTLDDVGLEGRMFRVEGWSDFSKQGIKSLMSDLRQANLTIRNFPSTVADLRKRLKIKEGGDSYLFATTLANGTHALIRCRKEC